MTRQNGLFRLNEQTFLSWASGAERKVSLQTRNVSFLNFYFETFLPPALKLDMMQILGVSVHVFAFNEYI